MGTEYLDVQWITCNLRSLLLLHALRAEIPSTRFWTHILASVYLIARAASHQDSQRSAVKLLLVSRFGDAESSSTQWRINLPWESRGPQDLPRTRIEVARRILGPARWHSMRIAVFRRPLSKQECDALEERLSEEDTCTAGGRTSEKHVVLLQFPLCHRWWLPNGLHYSFHFKAIVPDCCGGFPVPFFLRVPHSRAPFVSTGILFLFIWITEVTRAFTTVLVLDVITLSTRQRVILTPVAPLYNQEKFPPLFPSCTSLSWRGKRAEPNSSAAHMSLQPQAFVEWSTTKGVAIGRLRAIQLGSSDQSERSLSKATWSTQVLRRFSCLSDHSLARSVCVCVSAISSETAAAAVPAIVVVKAASQGPGGRRNRIRAAAPADRDLDCCSQEIAQPNSLRMIASATAWRPYHIVIRCTVSLFTRRESCPRLRSAGQPGPSLLGPTERQTIFRTGNWIDGPMIGIIDWDRSSTLSGRRCAVTGCLKFSYKGEYSRPSQNPATARYCPLGADVPFLRNSLLDCNCSCSCRRPQ